MKKVITFTTIPSRLKDVGEYGIIKCIQSLVDQDFSGDYEIHLNVPAVNHRTQEAYVVPAEIRQFSERYPKFKIFEGLEDKGSVTKIFYTLQRETDPETIIITCDDDLIYHPKMLEEQVKNQEKFQDTAVGYDGCRAERDNGEELFHDQRDHYVVSVYRNIYVSWLQNYKTVSYKRKFFSDDFYEFSKQSWNDDIVTSAYLGKQGISKLVTFYEHEEKLDTIEKWLEKGGVSTFPVLGHTHHEGLEGCNMYRHEKADDNFMFFVDKGYLK